MALQTYGLSDRAMAMIAASALASLSAEEISHATNALRQAISPSETGITFYEVSLHEGYSSDQKSAFFAGGDAATLPPRRAHIVAAIPGALT